MAARNIYISYSRHRDDAKIVKQLANYLEWQKGFNWTIVLLDEPSIQAIDAADLVIIFYSKKYANSENAAIMDEADYADQQQKILFAIYLGEVNMTGITGLLRLILTNAKDSVKMQEFCDIEPAAQEVVTKLCKLLSYSNFRLFNAPELPKWYCRRSKVLDGIVVSKFRWLSASTGVLVVTGPSGIGKTTGMSAFLQDPSNQEELYSRCGIQHVLWMNCSKWRDDAVFNSNNPSAVKAKFISELTKLSQHYTGRAGLLPDLLVCDDVCQASLVAFICHYVLETKRFACIMSRDNKITALKMDDNYQNLFEKLEVQNAQTPVFTTHELVSLIHKAFTVKTSALMSPYQFQELAQHCQGLPMKAVDAAHHLQKGMARNITKIKFDELFNDVVRLVEEETIDKKGKPGKFFETLALQEQNDSSSLSLLKVPIFMRYCERREDELRIVEGIGLLTTEPAASKGFFLITGRSGIGKTTLISATLRNPNLATQLNCDYNIHTVIWLNCGKIVKGSEESSVTAAISDLLKIGNESVTKSESMKWRNLTDMIAYFELNHKKRVLFVLDDVSNVSFLAALRNQCKNGLFLAILGQGNYRFEAGSLFAILLNRGGAKRPTSSSNIGLADTVTRNVFEVPPLHKNQLVAMFCTKFGMKDKLDLHELDELASRFCQGSPLVASLVAAQFYRTRSYHNRYDDITTSLPSWNSEQGLIKQLFRRCYEMLSEKAKRTFQGLLFFERIDEQITIAELTVHWSKSREMIDEEIAVLEDLSLVTRCSSNLACSDVKWAVQLHQLIYGAAENLP